jgi:hypothetical protein|tara:strand:- start:586 stop:900 length:315 start_codon:yes stop_codon:yes gene_type:complete
MNVKIFKLKNQEEFLCEVVEEKDGHYVIKNPCVLLPTQQQTIAMSPWLPFASIEKKNLEFDKDLVMLVVDVIEQIEEQYTKQFSAVLAPKSKIVTPNGPLGLAT